MARSIRLRGWISFGISPASTGSFFERLGRHQRPSDHWHLTTVLTVVQFHAPGGAKSESAPLQVYRRLQERYTTIGTSMLYFHTTITEDILYSCHRNYKTSIDKRCDLKYLVERPLTFRGPWCTENQLAGWVPASTFSVANRIASVDSGRTVNQGVTSEKN